MKNVTIHFSTSCFKFLGGKCCLAKPSNRTVAFSLHVTASGNRLVLRSDKMFLALEPSQ